MEPVKVERVKADPSEPAVASPLAPARPATPPADQADIFPVPDASPIYGPRRPVPNAEARARDLDPEPDRPVVPPPAPSTDPIDRAAPAAAAALPDTLPQSNAALKAALAKREAVRPAGTRERRKERDAIASFYAARGFAPVWSKDGRPVDAVASVLATLARAADDALTLAKVPTDLATSGGTDASAEAELALTEAVVSYARQATGSRIDPQSIAPLIGHRPALADPAEVLDGVVAAGSAAGDRLRALNPVEPRYAALRDKLAELHAARRPSDGPLVPPGPTLRVGMRDIRVPLLRARFHVAAGFGDDPDALRYDAAVADAVADFQRSRALPPSGSLTRATVDALSSAGQPSRNEGVIVANMEMWRWMARDLGANRIEVNVPDYLVTVYRDNRPVSANRVVVGKTDTPTPLFSNTMKYLIVNPYWNVPQSIIRKEMLPKGGGDLSYLSGRGYTVSWHGNEAVVKQLPGEKNALGRIKFLFPNDYAVYLHDTPSKALFAAPRRAFSHGCVRVDKPFAFAESVLNDALPDGARHPWSEGRLEGMIGDKERTVNLPVALPIHIAYFTASVDHGTLKLREDVYGYARAVAAALGHGVAPEVERRPRVAERVRRAQAVVDDGFDPR